MTEAKRFDEWIEIKSNLHQTKRVRSIHEGEIWWCAIGENVGVEINGKHEVFSRPVLVLRKLGQLSFMGVPLTSRPHTGSWYASFVFHNEAQFAALAQARVMSVPRLYKRMGAIPNSDFSLIKTGFGKLYLGSE